VSAATGDLAGDAAAAVAPDVDAAPSWTVRHAPWLLVALHVPFMVAPPLFTITRRPDMPARDAAVLVVVAAALAALQLRHSLAASRGRRARAWGATYLGVLALAYVPLWWYTWDWATSQWMVVASGAMVLRGRPAVVAVMLPVVGTAAVACRHVLTVDEGSVVQSAVFALYYGAVLVMGGAALYGSARLVRVVDELYAARVELADLAVGRERLRVSRDLHDLLGQSLSAVSLKGDLAVRLLATDTGAARAEIESLTGVARDALRDVRAVARDEHAVSLRTEIEAAASLLGAAGIDARLDVDLPDLAPRVEEALAWAVREGATNMLRHSDATACSIGAARRDGRVRLEMVNDGVRAPAGEGRGVAGLTERARELSGSVAAEVNSDGRFRLVVDLPGEGA
jgi:two-component system sensor histidine kinase DesK